MKSQTDCSAGSENAEVSVPPRVPEIYHPSFDLACRDASSSIRFKLEESFRQMAENIASKIHGGGTVLEAACGIGQFAHHLALALPDTRVIGEDIDAEAIEEAKDIYGGDVVNLEFRIGDVYTVGRRHSDLNLVAVHDSLHHLDDLGKALGQIHKSLSPGGVFYSLDLDRAAVYPELENNGKNKMLMDYLVKLRKDFPDEERVDVMRGDEMLAQFQCRIIAVMSAMAAYTSDELEGALYASGFRDIVSKVKDKRCECFATKPIKSQ